MSKQIKQMENEVHEALAMMDAETGKVLNYRQLMQSQKHKEIWSKLSANKFGRLENGVGGCIKGTNTIKFMNKHDIPSNRMRDVMYGKFVCLIRPEKKRNTSHAFYGWWQQNQLPRQSSYTNSRNSGCKTTFQQRHINTRRTFHDDGHHKFLSDDSSQTPRIRQNQTE